MIPLLSLTMGLMEFHIEIFPGAGIHPELVMLHQERFGDDDHVEEPLAMRALT